MKKHSARKTVALSCLIYLFCTLSAWAGSAEKARSVSMRGNPKLIAQDTILDMLDLDGGRTHVIVTLAKPVPFKSVTDLRATHTRLRSRQRIREMREAVLEQLDSNEIYPARRFSYMPSFSAEVTKKGLEQLLIRNDVAFVEPDRLLHAHTAQGIALMNGATVRSAYDGSGTSIAICDTGIDYTHPDLGGADLSSNAKVIGGYDFGGDSGVPWSEDGDPMDTNGHGTACAGIAAGNAGSGQDYVGGVAPGAKLYALKISYGSTGSAYESDMIAAWEWCISHKDDDPDNPILIISTSFGGGCYGGDCDTLSPAMATAATNASAAGITVFASSGNSGLCDCISWPACISDVISVGAVFDDDIGGWGFCVDANSCADNKEAYPSCSTGYIAWSYSTQADQVAPYTNLSTTLDLMAPSHFASTTSEGGGYRSNFGGTSAACPYAAGVGAIVQQAARSSTGRFLTPGEIKVKLTTFGDQIFYPAGAISKPRADLGAIDIDDDGMPAAWEIDHFGDLLRDGSLDTEMDELSDLEEYANGTDPTNPDTDGDGFTDGEEVIGGTDPLNGEEYPVSATVPAFSRLGFILGTFLLVLLGISKKIGQVDIDRQSRSLGSHHE